MRGRCRPSSQQLGGLIAAPITISVVTPCLNTVDYVGEAIESVTSQRGAFTLDYLVADGASTDGSLDIVRGRAPRWTSRPDEGMFSAIVDGFDETHGEIMGWLNADDVYLPGALSVVASVFTQLPEVEWLTTLSPVAIDAAGDVARLRKIPGLSVEALADGVYVGFGGLGDPLATEFLPQESSFWRRSLWERVTPAFLREHELAGDFALWCAFARESAPCGVEAPLGAFRVRHGQLSVAQGRYLAEARPALEELRRATGWAPKPPPGPEGVPYTGHRAFKEDIRDASSRWVLRDHPFVVLRRDDERKELLYEHRLA